MKKRSPVVGVFQHVHETDEVAADVRLRVRKRIADAGLGGQMHDGVEPLRLEQRGQRLGTGQIQPAEAKTSMVGQNRQPVVLQPDVVVLIQVVEPDDLIAPVEQPLADVKPMNPPVNPNQRFERAPRS